MLNRYVLDANVLVSAVLSPGSTANLAYQKALDTGILLIKEYVSSPLRPIKVLLALLPVKTLLYSTRLNYLILPVGV